MIIEFPVYQGVDLLDVTAPHEVLGWMGNPKPTLRIVGKTASEVITTRDGFKFLTSHGFNQILDDAENEDPSEVRVLWVPGGNPPELARLMAGKPDDDYLSFLRARAEKATWVCSVCEGALLLAAAGLLDGHKATTHWLFYPCLSSFEKIEVVPGFPRFVADGNRLTGGGISSGIDESLELVRLLTNSDAAVKSIQRAMQYYPKPPFPSDLQEPDTCEFRGLTQSTIGQ